MVWKGEISVDGSVSGLSLGMSTAEAKAVLGPVEPRMRRFDRESEEFNWLDYDDVGLQLLTDGGGTIVQILCGRESELAFPDGEPAFGISVPQMKSKLKQLGYKFIQKADGFFETDPELFGGRFYKRELIVFSVTEAGLEKRVLDSFARNS